MNGATRPRPRRLSPALDASCGAQYMEPRGAIGTYDPGEDRYTLYADINYPHRVRNMLANMVFKVPESKVRVVCHDVGGGFGAKGWQYVEHRLTLWAAKKLGRPVKWSCERSEVILADEHGRDNIGEIELAFDERAKILALRLHMLASGPDKDQPAGRQGCRGSGVRRLTAGGDDRYHERARAVRGARARHARHQ
jgi:CO/xanthine dehydrogenase Mo-binding subunit